MKVSKGSMNDAVLPPTCRQIMSIRATEALKISSSVAEGKVGTLFRHLMASTTCFVVGGDGSFAIVRAW